MAADHRDSLRERIAGAIRGSTLAGELRRVPDWVRSSWLYEWLTKEPDPEVIVIDLRETYTVGPIIRLIDRAVERLAPYWESSALKRGLDRLVAAGEAAADTRAGRLVVAALAPPEPPAESSETNESGRNESERNRSETDESEANESETNESEANESDSDGDGARGDDVSSNR